MLTWPHDKLAIYLDDVISVWVWNSSRLINKCRLVLRKNDVIRDEENAFNHQIVRQFKKNSNPDFKYFGANAPEILC